MSNDRVGVSVRSRQGCEGGNEDFVEAATTDNCAVYMDLLWIKEKAPSEPFQQVAKGHLSFKKFKKNHSSVYVAAAICPWSNNY